MNKIIRIHEKIFAHLLKLRELNPEFYYVPRKINNQNRLDKGYWFLGNEDYLHLSFWDGTDWKEKIHNIGFVVLKNGSSYIELSAQDSDSKASFFADLIGSVKGFVKDGSKNKWLKHYQDKDYLKNLDEFIADFKPIVDEMLAKKAQSEIRILDSKFFDKYHDRIIEKRRNHEQIGRTNKLSRIVWNTEGWRFPSGSQGKSIASDSYEANNGYGHEEWLMDKSKIIEDFHYAFLQPLLLKSDKHVNNKYNITLFTINSLNKRYLVGEIENVECITKEESLRIYRIYKKNGWIEKMRNDIERIGGNHKKFINTDPKIMFNVRFKFKDLLQQEELVEISDKDVNLTTARYKLLPKKIDLEIEQLKEVIQFEDEHEGNKKKIGKRKKVFNSECEFDPYHDQMQNALFDLLKKSSEYKKVFIEKGRVDIKALTIQNTWHYFELKTDNPKLSIRKALGQILEYAYFPDQDKAKKLIIVADENPDEKTLKYLNHIRAKFRLPISYRSFDLHTGDLSSDF